MPLILLPVSQSLTWFTFGFNGIVSSHPRSVTGIISLLFLSLGYGIFTNVELNKGDFICEYVGKFMSSSEGEALEKEYGGDHGSFMYFFWKYW